MMTFQEFLEMQEPQKVKAASGFHKGLKPGDHKIGRDERGGDRYKGFVSPIKGIKAGLHIGQHHLAIDGSDKESKGNTPVKVGKVVFKPSMPPSQKGKAF
jgi:hypothetical protein